MDGFLYFEMSYIIKMKRTIFFFLVLRYAGLLLSQDGEVEKDSLLSAWNQSALPDSQRAEALVAYMNTFAYSDYDSLMAITDRGLAFALARKDSFTETSLRNTRSIAFLFRGQTEEAVAEVQRAKRVATWDKTGEMLAGVLNTEGNIVRNMGRLDEAEARFQEALQIAERVGDEALTMKIIYNIASIYAQRGQLDTAIVYTKRSLEFSLKKGDPGSIGTDYNFLGILYFQLGELTGAADYYQKAVEAYNQMEDGSDPASLAGAYINLGNVYKELGKIPEAISYTERGVEICEEISYPRYLLVGLNGLANMNLVIGEREKAKTHYERAIALARETQNMEGLTLALNNLGDLLQEQAQLEEALPYFEESLKINEEIGNKRGIATDLLSLGAYYYNVGDRERCRTYYERSLALCREMGDIQGEGVSLQRLGELARLEQNYSQALIQLRESLEILEGSGNLENTQEVVESLYKLYRATGQSAKALDMHERFIQARDSLQNEENQRAIIRQQYAYEYQQQSVADSLANLQRQAETELAYQRELSQRNYLLFGALGLIILGIIGFLFVRNQQRIRIREKELSLQQEQAAKLQLREMDELKNHFFTNISHEFRTPLTVILGMADQLDETKGQERSLIRRNGRRLLRLINQLLDLARLEAQGLRFQWVQGDMVSYLRYLTESFQSLAQDRKIELKVETDLPELMMDYDAEKIQDIIYNLLSNALKFTPEEGKISVEIKQQTGQMHCTVRDTGLGIPEAELSRIFDRFHQGTNVSADNSTGVGLALVKALLEKMGGGISVESKIGQGTAFNFWLPIKTAAETPKAFAEPAPEVIKPEKEPAVETPAEYLSEPTEKERVLIIEDNPDVITYLGAVLGPNYHLLTATDGVSGVELALQEVPDLIISDLMMPGMNGYEVTQKLKTDPRTSHIPIIMLTAKATQDDKLAGLEQGADAYLVKPFDRAELLVRVEQLLGLRKTLQEKYRGEIALPPVPEKPLSLDEVFLQTARQTVLDQLTKTDLSVHDICEAVSLARTQVYRKLKALTGQSPTLFIRSIRLQKSRELLADPKLNVSEIAYEVGFTDPGYFTRVFSEEFGQTPTEMRGIQ